MIEPVPLLISKRINVVRRVSILVVDHLIGGKWLVLIGKLSESVVIGRMIKVLRVYPLVFLISRSLKLGMIGLRVIHLGLRVENFRVLVVQLSLSVGVEALVRDLK